MSNWNVTPPTSVNITVTPPPELNIVLTPTEPAPAPSAIDQVARDSISAHLIDPSPHPAYDDMVSMVLIFENHLI